jgi:hypothetical protein
MLSSDRIVGDDEAGLAVDESDGSAETPSPECSRVRLTGGFGVAESREGTRGVYLLAACGGDWQHSRQGRAKDQAKVREQGHKVVPVKWLLVY